MGYETQLLVGLDTKNSYSDDGTYFMVYAHVDMCRLGDSALFELPWENNTPDKNKWYFYAPCGDGDTQVTEDRYGTRFRPVPLTDVITALEMDTTNTDYCRIKWALALLKSIQENSNEELTVILWGY